MKKTTTKTLILALMGALAFSVSANAATFVVNTTADTQDATPADGICADAGGACSLRAAITEANALAGADIITLPAGTYTTTIAGTNENVNANGDYDITSALTINGAGSGTTIIQANAAPNTAPNERVMHITGAGATAVSISDVTVRHGNLTGVGSGSPTLNLSNAGAGIRIDAAATNTNTLTNVVITANSGNVTAGTANFFGAGIIVRGQASTGAIPTVTMTGCTVSNNIIAVAAGATNGLAGGIYNQDGTVNLVNSTVTGNVSSSFHGGIRTLSSTLAAATNITNSTISNNSAQGVNAASPGEGGGVVNIAAAGFASITTITGSTVSGNTALGTGSAGGGIENFSVAAGTGTVNLTNSTVSGNSAADAGGIYSDGAAARINLNFCTVAANSATGASPAGTGGGLYQDVTPGGLTNLKNSIVADNTATTSGPNIFGTITSQNFNHVESTAGGTFVAMANDVTGSDPVLGLLANNGGPTFTHLPGPSSPVLNTIIGNDCGTTVTVDQRGFTRPVGAGCEKGSVEIQAISVVSAVSRKTHAGVGDFDVNMPLTGVTGVESRSGGVNGDFTLVFTVGSNPLVSGGSASVTSGMGSVVGSPTFSGNTITVNLTGVTNAQTITVTLSGATDSFGQVLGSSAVNASFLLGDTNGNRAVNSGDSTQTKSRSGQTTTATNFSSDVNLSGSINSGDSFIVKANSGTALPP